MVLTDAEIKKLRAAAVAAVDRLHELTGGTVVLLIEQHHDDDEYSTFTARRGSPYAAIQMTRLYVEGDHNECLASEISRAISPPDEGDAWKEAPEES